MKPPPFGCFALHLLDVGQGEAIVLDFPNGSFALIDGGPSAAKDVVLEAVGMRVRERRVFRFAAFTHWDADHIGGLPYILQTYKPLDLVRPNVDLGLLKDLCARLGDKESPSIIDEIGKIEAQLQLSPIGARQSIPDIGHGVEVWALAPGKTARARMKEALSKTSVHDVYSSLNQVRNDVSLVLWIRAFGRSLFLPGEVGSDTASELFQQFGEEPSRIHHSDPRAVWIKLSHHGSRTGTSSELLRIFAQQPFVASASHGSQYGHPHPRVLQLVREGGHGRTMCTRLGKGCRLIQEDPVRHPADDPSWTATGDWKTGPALNERCYGTLSVTVHSDGACSVEGALTERNDCPYGGPPGGRIDFPPLPPESLATLTAIVPR